MASPLLKAAQSAIKAANAIGATKTVTLRRTLSEYIPSTRTTADAVTDYSWTAVVERYADTLVDGSSILRGDRRLTGAAADLSVTPDPETDTIVMDGLTWQFVEDGLMTDPATATWSVQVRR